jgi:hypothetical protein
MTIQELKTKIEELQKELERMEAGVVGEWPQKKDECWVLDECGAVDSLIWDGSHYDKQCKKYGIFRTESEAKAEKMRRESMSQRGEMPEEGEQVWFWDFVLGKASRSTFNYFDSPEYWIGSVKKTEEECEEWGRKYAKYFERQ